MAARKKIDWGARLNELLKQKAAIRAKVLRREELHRYIYETCASHATYTERREAMLYVKFGGWRGSVPPGRSGVELVLLSMRIETLSSSVRRLNAKADKLDKFIQEERREIFEKNPSIAYREACRAFGSDKGATPISVAFSLCGLDWGELSTRQRNAGPPAWASEIASLAHSVVKGKRSDRSMMRRKEVDYKNEGLTYIEKKRRELMKIRSDDMALSAAALLDDLLEIAFSRIDTRGWRIEHRIDRRALCGTLSDVPDYGIVAVKRDGETAARRWVTKHNLIQHAFYRNGSSICWFSSSNSETNACEWRFRGVNLGGYMRDRSLRNNAYIASDSSTFSIAMGSDYWRTRRVNGSVIEYAGMSADVGLLMPDAQLGFDRITQYW